MPVMDHTTIRALAQRLSGGALGYVKPIDRRTGGTGDGNKRDLMASGSRSGRSTCHGVREGEQYAFPLTGR